MSEQETQQKRDAAATALQAGEFAQAKELYQDLLQSEPESATALYSLGSIALQEKDYKSALDLFGKAAIKEPEAVDIAFNFASALATVGDRLGALLQLQRASRYCRDDTFFVPRIADLSIRLGEPAAAITLLSRLARLTPSDQIIMANAESMLGNWRGAVNLLKRLHKSVPGDPDVANKLAIAAGRLRDYDLSIASFEEYLRLVTPTAADYLRFADLLLIAQNAKRCDQALDMAIKMGEDSADVYLLRARTARLRGDYPAVASALDSVFTRQSNHGQAWAIKAELTEPDQLAATIAELQIELDQTDEVAKLNHRHQSLLHYAMADMQDRAGNYSAASEAMKDANQVQYSALQLINSTYNEAATEQQFDRAITAFNAAVFDQQDPVTNSNETALSPIFIVGMPRSGTTLVERILGQNAQVENGGEQEAMEFVAAHFWQQVKTGRWQQPEQLEQHHWAELRQMYLQKLPDISKPIFTDKLPHNFRNVGLILKLFPEARIIQMHRDIKDVCLSIYERAFAPGHNYATRWPELIHFYRQSEKLMAHWSALSSPRILDLHYEDLVTDPQKHARQLVEFCGFAWDDNYLEFHKSVNQSFTFSEMQVRQPIAAKRIGRWSNYAEFFPDLAALQDEAV